MCPKWWVGVGWDWPGVAEPKSRLSGCEGGHAGIESSLGAPRALTLLLVGEEVAVDDVGEASFQRPDRFLLRFAFG